MKAHINLNKYLQSHSSNEYIIELLEYEINKRIYYYGRNFRTPWKPTKTLDERIWTWSTQAYRMINSSKNKHAKTKIFSDAYFNLNKILVKRGFEIINPDWSIKREGKYIANVKFQGQFNRLQQIIFKGELGELLSNSTLTLINDFIQNGKIVLSKRNIIAGIFSNDLNFFPRLFIDLFEQLNVPTFIYLHGLPGRYNSIDDNRADYLLVWGQRIKENYIREGVPEDKIMVTGHPQLSVNESKPKLKFSFEKILVISKAISGAPSDSKNPIDENKAAFVVYLFMVQRTLLSIGINSVKLRIHPSENAKWYRGICGNSFFKIDKDTLHVSLEKSTLVIGPTTTVFLDAIHSGVNFLVFEPRIYRTPLVDPFDGSNPKVPVARDEDDLLMMLRDRISVDPSVLKEYINPEFNINELVSKIK